MKDRIRIGVVGCGSISGAYLGMAKNFPVIEVVACADLELERARNKAAQFGVPRALDVDQLLKSPDVDLVLNLTIPKAHAEVALRAWSGALADAGRVAEQGRRGGDAGAS